MLSLWMEGVVVEFLLVVEVVNGDENAIGVEGVVGHRVEDEKLHCLGRHVEMIMLLVLIELYSVQDY